MHPAKVELTRRERTLNASLCHFGMPQSTDSLFLSGCRFICQVAKLRPAHGIRSSSRDSLRSGGLVDNKILFVDDDTLILEGYRRLLHQEFSVSTAIGGQQGLAVLSTSGPFAVVISDMRMPGMNGAEFLAKVRNKTPDTVRMLLTGYSDLEAAIKAVNQGSIFRYLSKPCEKEEIVKAIESGLAIYRQTAADKELIKKAQLLNHSALGWDTEDFARGPDFPKLDGLSGPSEARVCLEPLFNPNSPYYVVLVKLTALPIIEERYGAEARTKYAQSTAQFLLHALTANDRLFHWSRDVLMMVVKRPVSVASVRMEITRLLLDQREYTIEVSGRRIMLAAPTTFDPLPVSKFSTFDDMLAAFDAKLIGKL
jgi:ActR/RegA family two-component response regulator